MYYYRLSDTWIRRGQETAVAVSVMGLPLMCIRTRSFLQYVRWNLSSCVPSGLSLILSCIPCTVRCNFQMELNLSITILRGMRFVMKWKKHTSSKYTDYILYCECLYKEYPLTWYESSRVHKINTSCALAWKWWYWFYWNPCHLAVSIFQYAFMTPKFSQIQM